MARPRNDDSGVEQPQEEQRQTKAQKMVRVRFSGCHIIGTMQFSGTMELAENDPALVTLKQYYARV